jgi:hypothetical protein
MDKTDLENQIGFSEGIVFELYSTGKVMWKTSPGGLFDTFGFIPHKSEMASSVDLSLDDADGIVIGSLDVFRYLEKTGRFWPNPQEAEFYFKGENQFNVYWGCHPKVIPPINYFAEKNDLFPLTVLPPGNGTLENVLKVTGLTGMQHLLAFEKISYSDGKITAESSFEIYPDGCGEIVRASPRSVKVNETPVSRSNWYIASQDLYIKLTNI